MILFRSILTALVLAASATVGSTGEPPPRSDTLTPAEREERAAQFFPGWPATRCTR